MSLRQQEFVEPSPFSFSNHACETMVVRFGDDWELVVPNRVDLLTPYVLLEQERWFEPEIDFIRRWLKPGMRVIDIGANHGVYTVPMADLVGPTGAVWAFEPCQNTFDLLRQSARHNRLSNTTVIKAAVGAGFDMLRLATGTNSELNQITVDQAVTSEWVDQTTLNYCARLLEFNDIDFIKLDAEGYETHVLDGADELLRRSSPLIMFEFKHNESFNFEIIEKLDSLNYDIYVLIQGANTLVPWSQSEHNDLLLINLFACKSDRAEALIQQGCLVSRTVFTDDFCLDQPSVLARDKYGQISSKQQVLVDRLRREPADRYSRAACLTLIAESSQLSPLIRLQAAHTAFANCAIGPEESLWMQALRARLATFLGKKSYAAKLSAEMMSRLRLSHLDPPTEVMAACSRYDGEQQDADYRRRWFAASVHECFERSRAWSSWMLGSSCLANLDVIDGLGFLPCDLERRRQLIYRNFYSGPTPSVPDSLLSVSSDNKNSDYWIEQNNMDRERTANTSGVRGMV